MGKKEYIRRKAFRLFIDSGFSDVSVNDIINSLNITKGCFYYYYTSKDELIEDVFDYYVASYFREILNNITEDENEPKNKLLRFYIDLISYDDFIIEKLKEEAVDYERFHYLLAEATRRFDYVVLSRRKFFQDALAAVKSVLEKAKLSGIVKHNVDTDKYAIKILTNNESLILLYLLFKDFKIKKAAAELFNEIWQDICVLPGQTS